MRVNFTIGRWVVSIHNHARRPWSRITSYTDRHTTLRAWYWGRFVLELEDWTAEVYPVCAACGSPDVGERSCGDEGWTVCEACCSVEQGYRYVNLQEWESAT